MIVIFICAPKLSSNEFVFTKYNNQTGFENALYISMLGLLASMYAFSGYEGGATMAEETTDASISAPRGIIFSIIASAITGFILILAILYGCGENMAYIINGPSDHAVVNLFDVVLGGR